ncbi:fluoride efflux transporter CrcB [bacterium]|nr:fluoride efflux transporter CrcB [bacterium]
MTRTVLVAVGGLVGSVARYWVAGWAQAVNGGQFPVGTLTVNVLGSFVIGLLMTLSLERGLISPEVRILLATGFCGGFTTMSTFSYETMALLREGSGAGGFANLGVTLAACLASVWGGTVVGRLL